MNKQKQTWITLCEKIIFVYIHVIKKIIHKMHNTEMLGHYRSYEETVYQTKISTKIDTRHQQSQGSNSDINSMKSVMLSEIFFEAEVICIISFPPL